MNTFPRDCWGKECVHFHVYNMSVDDYVCYCDILKCKEDACNGDFSLAKCPKDTNVAQGGNMIKVFISQPMNGKTDEEIQRERVYAAQWVGQQVAGIYPDDWDKDGNRVEIMDTVFKDFSTDTHPLVYLGESIKMLADADVVYFAKGWENARGCCIEHECAKKYGKYCMYY